MDDKVKVAIITGVFAIVGYVLTTPGLQFWVNHPPDIDELMPTPPSPQFDGTNITWTAKAKDPDDDPLLYKFQLNGPATENLYVDQQNWSTKSEWTWKSTYSDIGTNFIRVWIKDKKHEPVVSNSVKYIINNRALEEGELIYSNIRKMNLSENYYFSACIAVNDSESLKAAREQIDEITTGTDVEVESIPISDTSINDTSKDVKTGDTIDHISLKVAPRMRAILEGKNFIITRIYPDEPGILSIPLDKPGYNYGLWRWEVTPTQKSKQCLTLIAEEVHENNEKSSIKATSITIEVVVNPETITAEEAKAENVTTPLAKRSMPGFKAVFAVAGLLAVAYLISRKRRN